jgi:putative DNA primase/helicase
LNTNNSKATPASGIGKGQGNVFLVAALSYVDHGWPVFPVHSVLRGLCSCGIAQCDSAGKHPRTNHGLGDATFDVSIIQNWWQLWPDANIGLVAGSDSRLVVLDVDPRHCGDETLAALEDRHGGLPKTVESLTGGGGQHILFQHPGGYIKSRSIGPGLDIKADGGYIVAPPSVHGSGQTYIWEISSQPEDIPLAPMPSWLHELVIAGPPKRNSASAQTTDRIPHGSRNNTLASLAGSMRRSGMSQSAIEAALLEENKLRCDPPLAESEVEKIAASVSQYRPAISTGTVTTSAIGLDCPPNIETVRQTVATHFPHLWPAVDLGLAACATLLLADHAAVGR